MRRLLLVSLVLVLAGGVAAADRHRDRDRDGHRDRDRHYDRGPVVRDHRAPVRVKKPHRAIHRRPVYVTNGRYTFHGGVTRTYVRPVIRQRYFDYRVRPQVIVEAYDPVPGYVWVAGSWRWSGREWIWSSGYWAVDSNVTIYEDDY